MTSIGSSSSVEAPDSSTAQAQLVVALASYNDAATIASVARAIDTGLTQEPSASPSRIQLADGGSTDGTIARARDALRARAGDLVEVQYPRSPGDLLQVPYHGLPGRAHALRAILAAARDLHAESCVVLDAGITTMAADWIPTLAGPVLHGGYDYVAPFYQRHAYEGALTKGLAYPLLRALYGVRLRQPAASEFACSRRMLELFLDDDDLWEREGAEIGIDVWLTTTAAVSRFTLGEAALGPRRHQSRGEDRLDLRTVLAQVAGAVFADLDARADVWQRVRQSMPVGLVGQASGAALEAPPIDVNGWMDAFRLGYRELREIWGWVLPPKAIIDLRKLANASGEGFRLDNDLWARIVYDFALAYRLRVLPRDHLLGSLTPLYLGWLASFVLQIREQTPADQDAHVERLAQAFEGQKPYLVSRWRWPEKFRT
jgi:glucosylglycerate synthase